MPIPKSCLNIIPEYRVKDKLLVRVRALRWQYRYWNSNVNTRYRYLRVNAPNRSKLRAFKSHIDWLEYIIQLDVYSVICNTISGYPARTCDHVRKYLGIYIPRRKNWERDLAEKRLKPDVLRKENAHPAEIKEAELQLTSAIVADVVRREMRDKTIKTRVYDTQTRWILETSRRVHEGWFVIYNTLTCNDDTYRDVFRSGSSAWTDYVRKVDREVGIALHGSWRKALAARSCGDEWHTYYAVVERGEKRGRYHIHCVHHLKALPRMAMDANAGRTRPVYTQLACFWEFWPHGHSVPKMCRFGAFDAFGLIGYVWPCEMVARGVYKPIDISGPAALAGYLAKYLTKRHEREAEGEENQKSEVLIWRSRQSHKIGLEVIYRLTKMMTKQQLRLMSRPESPRLVVLGRTIPKMISQMMAIKSRIRLMFRRKLQRTFLKRLLELERPDGPLRQLMKGDLGGILNRTIPRIGGFFPKIWPKEITSDLKRKLEDISFGLFGEINEVLTYRVGAGIQVGSSV